MKDIAASEERSTIETPDMPAGWTMATVGDVGTVELGRQRSPENHSGPCMRPYLRAANVTWAGIDLSDVLEMNFDEADFARFSLAPGDVLLNEGSGSAAEVGKPAVWRGEIVGCCFQNTLLRVRPEACTSEFLERFFYYCAKTRRFVPSTQGVNIFHIGKAGLSRFQMPLPPLPEQPRIVAKLDRLSARSRAARDHLARTAKLAARAKQAILAAAFRGELLGLTAQPTESFNERCWDLPNGWRWVRFDEVATVTPRLTTPSEIPDLLHLAPDNVEARTGRLLPCNTIAEDGVISAKHRFFPGQIIYSKIRPYLRKAVIVDFAGACSADMYPINCGEQVEVQLLHRWLISEDFAWFTAEHEGRTVLPKINQKELNRAPFPLPPVEHQREIVRRIEAAFARIDRLTAEAARAAHLLDRLDERLLAKAFRGELVPQDPADEPAAALLARIRAARAETRPRRGRRSMAAAL